MRRIATRAGVIVFSLLWAANISWAQTPVLHLKPAKARTPAGSPRVAPVPQQLFSSIPVATRSEEARKFVELSLEKYENVLLNDAVVNAQHATEKDPHFALSFAVLSFVSRQATPNAPALSKAKALLPRASADEQLLARWLINVQERNLLPAIVSMNELLKRYPQNKHVLYLTSTWLYGQQDYERSVKMMEDLLQLDGNFSPVMNMLGYAYIEASNPEPAKAVTALQRYIQLEPSSPNPEDSLGEVLRYVGDDQGSLEHFSAALQLDPTFFTSRLGLGDTLTLMGDYENAREEYDKSFSISGISRNLMHAKFQKTLVYFWEGHAAEGRVALGQLIAEAKNQNEPYAQFEAGLAAAMLSANAADELGELRTLEKFLENSVPGMNDAFRGGALASALREHVRVAAQSGQLEDAASAIAKLEQCAAQSGDLVVTNSYETARGFLLLAQGNLTDAAAQLSSDPRSPLAVQRLGWTQAKLGDSKAAAAAKKQFRYNRAPTVEWYLATHQNDFDY